MIIKIAAEMGGVGKSLLEMHRAALAEAHGVDVVLLDKDAQGSLTSRSSIRNQEVVDPAINVFNKPPKNAR